MSNHLFSFETAALSDPGLVREENEDNWFVDESKGIWLVADGMGGHTNGKLASAKVVECARTVGFAVSAPDLQARFHDRMLRANGDLLSVAHSTNAVLGSTMVAVLVFGNHLACVWAGDSRAYLIRGGVLHQISRDHTEVQDLLDKAIIDAEQARTWPRRNVITRAVGVFDELELDMVQGQIEEGDRILLCSDGLTGHVTDVEIGNALMKPTPSEACQMLVDLTLERGARDNVTVIVLQCHRRGATTVVDGRTASSYTAGSTEHWP